MVFIKNKVKNMYKYQEKYIQLEWICLFKSINYWKIQFFLNEYYKWNIYYFLTCLGRIKKKKKKAFDGGLWANAFESLKDSQGGGDLMNWLSMC